jgi:hypothetical protein
VFTPSKLEGLKKRGKKKKKKRWVFPFLILLYINPAKQAEVQALPPSLIRKVT